MATLYSLKPAFQGLLRPTVQGMHRAGVTANQVTVVATAGSIMVGAGVSLAAADGWYQAFLVMPVWLFLRMALNAVDGMLAREHGQKSVLGGYLNELGDVVSDAALMIPFMFVAPFTAVSVFALIFLGTLTEFAGVLASAAGTARRYDGPSGKSDRALGSGAVALWIGLGFAVPGWFLWVVAASAVLLVVTTVNRVRNGIAAAKEGV